MSARFSDAWRLARGKKKSQKTHVVRLSSGEYVQRVWEGPKGPEIGRTSKTNNSARPYNLAGATDIAKRLGGTVEPWAQAESDLSGAIVRFRSALTEARKPAPTVLRVQAIEKEVGALKKELSGLSPEEDAAVIADINSELAELEERLKDARKRAERAAKQRVVSRARYGAMRSIGMTRTPHGWE